MVGFLCLLLLAAVGSAHASQIRASEVEALRDLELELLDNFSNYATELRERLLMVDGAIEEYTQSVQNIEHHPDLYLSNPAYAFKLIRHMRQDWQAWQSIIYEKPGPKQITLQKILLHRLPKESLLSKSMENLLDIARFYDISPAVFQRGEMTGLELSPLDSYHLAVELKRQGRFQEALNWLEIAVPTYSTSELHEFIGVPHWRLYELHAELFLFQGKRDLALGALNAAINLDPYNVDLRQQRLNVEKGYVPTQPEPALPAIMDQKQLQCRIPESKIQTNLLCKYNKVTCDFLKLAPIALEGILEKPLILHFHNVIYDREIEYIRHVLHDCPSSMRFGGEVGVQGCHLPDDYSLETQLINVRIEHMTSIKRFSAGLAVIEFATTETLDILQLQPFENFHLDDVEGSIIMFLNDVPYGGAVTWPYYDTTVYPRRGDALISFHEALEELQICPNIVGTTLVIAKLIL